MSETQERCPVCQIRTTFITGDGTKPCDNCNVPITSYVPIFNQSESGYVLRISNDALAHLREFYTKLLED